MNDLSVEIVRVGDRAYFKAGVDFWKHVAGNTESLRLADKWISSSATSGKLAGFSKLTDLDGLIAGGLEEHGELEKGSQGMLNGQPVVLINDTTQGGSVYVATTGKPYPMKVVVTSAEGGAVTLDNWDAPVLLTEPTGSIDLDSLVGAGI